MLEVTLGHDPEFELSRADIDRPPPHYAIGTMEWLEVKHPNDEFVYLMGSDSLRDLHSWYRSSEFLVKCKALGVLYRRGAEVDLEELENELPGISSKVHYFTGPSIDITARDIRERVNTGARYEYLVPHGVAEVIRRHGLYL
jgi:nicotinate-nucleotide adenylyltransferase